MKRKITFYIWAPDYDVFSGGNVALHKLAHTLVELGERAVLITHKKHPEWKGEIYDNSPIDYLNSIIVYPEIIVGNPYNFIYIMRWVLNTPGVMGGDGIYGDDDLVYKFVDYFDAPDETKVKGELRTFNLQLDKFVDRRKHTPGKVCYIVRKGKDKKHDQHPPDAICLDNYQHEGGIDYLAKVFNECEQFISYDHATFIACQAVLCGCPPVVIPDGKLTKEEWRAAAITNQYGIAYGFDDIEWAVSTRDKAIEVIKSLETESVTLTKQFIQDTYQHIATQRKKPGYIMVALKIYARTFKRIAKKVVKKMIGR